MKIKIMLSTPKQKSVLPGFGLTLGFTLFYLSLIVLIPILTLFLKSASLSGHQFWEIVTAPNVLASYQLTFGTSLVAALINTFFGLLLAWVLVRYSFPGRGFIDLLIDLPFALPTAVAGITLSTLYSRHGFLGKFFEARGISIVSHPLGIIVALTFIGLPYVVRTVQPILQDMDRDMEEASACLGAKRWGTFRHILFPAILPALLTGFALSFARALGEYGSVVFIASNLPMKGQVVSLLIYSKLDQYDYTGATAIAVVMLLTSFVLLFIINLLQGWAHWRHKGSSS